MDRPGARATVAAAVTVRVAVLAVAPGVTVDGRGVRRALRRPAEDRAAGFRG